MSTIFEAIDEQDEGAAVAAMRADPALAAARHASGPTPVLYALYHGRSDLARALAHAADGRIGLAEAAAVDDTDRVGELLAGGIAPDAPTPDGFTPLQLAAFFGAPGVAAALLKAGADVNAVADNEMRIQPLHAAAAGRHGDVAALLVAAKADVNARQRHGWAPLHSAAHNGDAELVSALLHAGADPRATNDDGRTAAELAAEAGHDSIRALIDGHAA
jgi:ankyrin repeat protein